MPEHSPSRLRIYRSHLTSPEQRKHITVAREPIVQDTLEVLRGSTSRRSKHHFLFIGPRGIGKSHLLSLVEDGIAADSELATRYHVVRFPEEAHRILSFADFLLGLCEILRDTLPDEPLWSELYSQLHTNEDDALIVDMLVPKLRRENQKKKRTLLVMMENLNELFNRQIKQKTDIAALRKFFMEDNHGLLIATAPVHFDGVTSVDEPFYDFFDTQILNNLSEQQTIDLVYRSLEWDKRDDLLGNFEKLRPRLHALYRMTAGNPRLTVMLYELIAYDSITRVREQMEFLLDRITPFYQDRLNDLSPQERAVLETMARMRDQEKTPASIAKRMRMNQPQTSTLLRRLNDAHYIRSTPHPNDKRSRLYNIREGFFDIWLAMNLSRSARQRIPYLLDFYEMFYPTLEAREEKRAALRKKIEASEDPDVEGALDYLTEIGDPNEKAKSKLTMAGLLASRGVAEKAAGYLWEARSLPLDPVGKWIVDHAVESIDYLTEIEDMIASWDAHRSGDMESFAERLLKIGDSFNYQTFSQTKLSFLEEHLQLIDNPDKRAELHLRTADILHGLARWQEAETHLRNALDEVNEASLLYSILLNDLAQLLMETNRLSEAEPLMKQALAMDEQSFGSDHPSVATRLNNLAGLLMATNRLKEAEPLMRQALEINESFFGPDDPKVAMGLNNLASLLYDTNRLKEAELLMQRVLRINEASYGPEHPRVATALGNLADLLRATHRLAEAESLAKRALLIDETLYGPDHPSIAIRLNNLATLLYTQSRLEEAEPLVRRALLIDEKSYGANHPKVAIGLNNLAQLLQATNRLGEAEPLMERALAIDEESFGPDHPNVAIRLNNLAQLFQATNRLKEAEPLIQRALLIDEESFGASDPNVARGLNNLAKLFQATNRLTEAEPLMRRALVICAQFLGTEHPNSQIVLGNYAGLLKEMGMDEVAIQGKLRDLLE